MDGEEPPNIIIFSWDGFQRDHFIQLLRKGSLPNIKKFMEGGVFLNLTVMDYRTQTKPGHAQMLTGYRGRHTGVYSNQIYFHPVPDGYTLLERVERYFGEDNVITCMITGKRKNIEVDEVAELEKPEYCERGVFSNVSDDIDVNLVSENVSDVVGLRMIGFIQNYGSEHFVAFFHFAEPDRQGHEFGENSIEYDQGAMSCDYWFGEILDKLSEMGIMNRTLIYVMTDHGFNEGRCNHRHEPDIWLVTNDRRLKVNENETHCDMIDLAPTIYNALEIDKTIFTPKLEGFPLQEELPTEADSRTALLNDDTPPVITFDSFGKSNEITITNREDLKIKLNISDKNKAIGYLLLNNSLLNIYRNENIYEGKSNELICEYVLDASNCTEAKYIISVMTFDERENLEISSNTIIIKEHKSIFEKLNTVVKNMEMQILTFSLIAITIILIINRKGISLDKS